MTASFRAAASSEIGPRGVALIVAAAFFMIFLDGSILNTSLPKMASSFHLETVEVNVTITSYILAAAAFISLSGWIADRFGSKRVFAFAIGVFTLASVGCAASAHIWQLVAFRFVQGFGAALMTPVGRTIVLKSASKNDLLAVTALIAWPALFAPVIGPVLGGAITTWLNWRWNFLLNLPLGVIGVALVLLYVPEEHDLKKPPLDVVGAALTSSSLISLIYGLELLPERYGTTPGLLLLFLAVALGVATLGWFRRAKPPLLDLSLFEIPTFGLSTVQAGCLFTIAISATPFLLPLMLQLVWRLSPVQAGGFLLIYFLGNLAMKTVTTPLLRRFGFRDLILISGVVIAASIGACGFLTGSTPIAITNLTLFIAGAARSMEFTALSTLTFADVPDSRRAASSTLSAMAQQVAMVLGVALAALALQVSQYARRSAALAAVDFRLVFLGFGFVALAATLIMRRLHPDAGHEVSGRPRRDLGRPRTARAGPG